MLRAVVDSLATGYSKLANILFANQLQKGFDKDNVPITAVSLHPGRILTGTSHSYFMIDSDRYV